MSKYLIINADDFGMCHSANLAVFDLFQKGAITSSTIMTPCAWAKEAGVWAAAHPEYAVGVHLTFTSEWANYRWSPISHNNTKTLRDAEDFMFYGSREFEQKCELSEVENEIRAQIKRFCSFGVTPSHLDNHMGTLYGIQTGRFDLLRKIFDIASEYRLPFRFPGRFTEAMFDNDTLDIQVPPEVIKGLFDQLTAYAGQKGVLTPDYLIPGEWNGAHNQSYEDFKKYMYELIASFPEGITETYIHPALESEELKSIVGNWRRRVWEHRLFADPATLQHIKDCGIELISYRDLQIVKR